MPENCYRKGYCYINQHLVMADEPTANLDAENSHNIMRILTKLNEELDTLICICYTR